MQDMPDRAAAIEVYGGDYEHVLDLSGTHSGVEIKYVIRPVLEIFEGMLAERRYECCEFSLANYIILKDRKADWLHAMPIFPYRAFRHSTLYVRADSPLKGPADLRGKRVGVPDYSMTAAVWTRGILKEQYGVDSSEIQWIASGRQRFEALPGVRLQVGNSDLEVDVIEGRLDAIMTPTLEQSYRDGVAPDEAAMRAIVDAAHYFAPELETLAFPAWDCLPYDRASPALRAWVFTGPVSGRSPAGASWPASGSAGPGPGCGN